MGLALLDGQSVYVDNRYSLCESETIELDLIENDRCILFNTEIPFVNIRSHLNQDICILFFFELDDNRVGIVVETQLVSLKSHIDFILFMGLYSFAVVVTKEFYTKNKIREGSIFKLLDE
jgi:hypothetical protein